MLQMKYVKEQKGKKKNGLLMVWESGHTVYTIRKYITMKNINTKINR